MVRLAPRAREKSVRPRRLADVVARPLSFTVRAQIAMGRYFKSRLVKVGLALLLLGSGPLLLIIAAAAVGLWPDPDPNPVGWGLLCGLTFWPALICILVGVIRVRRSSAL